MNERIRELYNKVFAESMNMRWNIEDAEKFAGLIVVECLSIVDDEGCGEGGSIRAIEKIREHFGVEQ